MPISEKLGKGENDVRSAEDEEKDVGDDKNDKLDESSIDISDYITDIPEDSLIVSELKVPTYKQCRSNSLDIGKSMVKEVSGYHCDKCRRFMLTNEDMSAHLRSLTHYRNFVQEIKSLQVTAEAEIKDTNEVKFKIIFFLYYFKIFN